MNITEKDRLQDMLNSEKEIVKTYGTFITEASSTELRTLLKTCMFENSEDQFSVFEKMQEKNYYNPKSAQATEIMQAKTSFSSMKNQLSE